MKPLWVSRSEIFRRMRLMARSGTEKASLSDEKSATTRRNAAMMNTRRIQTSVQCSREVRKGEGSRAACFTVFPGIPEEAP